MDHDNLKLKLYEFYDGELSKEEALLFSSHLESCQECRSELELLKEANRTFFTGKETSISTDFTEQVMGKILKDARAGQKSGWRETVLGWLSLPKWEVATALSMSLLIFSYFSIDYLKSHQPSETNPMDLLYNETGIEQGFFSKNPEEEELLKIAFGNTGLDESAEATNEPEQEVKVYE